MTTPAPASSRTIVYTDGACSGNPGPGGWAWVVPDGEAAFGGDQATTNQRMELAAVLEAVRALPGPLHVVSDSTYVVNCFRDNWWRGWLKRGWKNSQKKPVANRDLWEPLIELYQQRDITFEWVKGHSGDRWNDRADELAVLGRDQANPAMAAVGALEVDDGEAAGALGAESGEAADGDAVAGASIDVRRIAVVGLRPPELGGYDANPTHDAVRRQLGDIIAAKREMFGRVQVLSGLQLGTETLAAEAALAADAELVVVLAFPDPAARWPKASQARFDELLDQAVDVIVIDNKVPASTADAGKAFGRRDRWLHDNADEAIVVHDGVHRGVDAQLRSFERALGDDVWVVEAPAG